ncbi:hypothetical protein ACRASX_08725 [Flavobacterium sp. TMP13]|uniref:hypothetical protein n=1 Tax=Flavobacterium sp. TMP13 TaxID=3425950 RepID=UPI003D7703EF
MANRFVIPQSEKSIIATIEDNKIVELGSINIPYHSITIVSENLYFVSIFYKEKALKIFNKEGELIAFNNQFDFKTIAVKNNTVYLGGAYKSKKNGAG